MEFFSVQFDESAIVDIEPGIQVDDRDGVFLCEFGTDVGGETLNMLSLRAGLIGFDLNPAGFVKRTVGGRLMRADLIVTPDGKLLFRPEKTPDNGRVFVVFRAMQRSPDARTETADYGTGVTCVGNALDRPYDVQLLVLELGATVEFRRFGRGGEYGPWLGITWNGTELIATNRQTI